MNFDKFIKDFPQIQYFYLFSWTMCSFTTAPNYDLHTSSQL